MQRQASLAIVSVCLLLSATLPADTVILKNGKRYSGVVQDQGGDKIVIKTDQIDLTVPRSQIESIDRDTAPDHFVREGERLMAEGDFDGARAAYVQALDMDKDNETARKAIEKIDAMSPEQRHGQDKSHRAEASRKHLREARELMNRTLMDQAMESMAKAVEADPSNLEAVQLAAESFLQAWIENEVPVSMVDEFLSAYEKIDPSSARLAVLREARTKQLEKRKLVALDNADKLFEEVLLDDKTKTYNAALLNKIERLLEKISNTGETAILKGIQADVTKAGIRSTRLSLGPSRAGLQNSLSPATGPTSGTVRIDRMTPGRRPTPSPAPGAKSGASGGPKKKPGALPNPFLMKTPTPGAPR